jgi:outer membrane protein assembly factor BamD
LPKDELYLKGKNYLLRGEFFLAAKEFEKIEGNYPFTPEANRAIVLASYSHYKRKDYDESLGLIEYFKKINFGNADLEYMYFLEILNNLGKIEAGDKNIAVVREAIRLADDFKKQFFEESPYWSYLSERRAELVDLYIKKEMEIVDFYIFNNNMIGAFNHLKSLDEEFYSEEYGDDINLRFFELYKYLDYKEGMNKYFLLLENGKMNAKR